MAAIDRDTLKSWFVRGAKPLASQFAAWIDSFVHVTDTVPASQILGLADELNLKADATALTIEVDARTLADQALQTALNDKVDLASLADKVDKSVISQIALQVTDSGKMTLNSLSIPAGKNWTVNNSETLSGTHNYVSSAFGNGVYVIMSQVASDPILVSKDGLTFQHFTNGFRTDFLFFGNGKFISIGWNALYDSNIYESTDGETWTPVVAIAAKWQCGVYANGKYICASDDGKMMTSIDALTWTQQSLPVSDSWKQVIYEGQYVLVGYAGNILTSSDAVIWVLKSNLPANPSASSICYGNGMFIIGDSNWTFLWESTDLINWTQITGVVDGTGGIVFTGRLFVIWSYFGYIATSSDGLAWTMNSINVPNTNWSTCVYNAGLLLIIAMNAAMIYSKTEFVGLSIVNDNSPVASLDATGCLMPKYSVLSMDIPPASATDTGTLGEIRVCADYIYVCIATNTWVRTALTTWGSAPA